MMGSQVNATEEESDYTQYVDEIVNKFAKDMKRRFGLVCEGSGGSMPYDVEEIMVNFQMYHKVSIEEARKLEIEATEALVKMINDHEKIRPYLREFPFPAGRTEVQIGFVNKRGLPHTDGSVVFLFQARDRLLYRKVNKQTERLEPLYEESYEEAYNKVYPPKIEVNPSTP
jgi:hypothetical protein